MPVDTKHPDYKRFENIWKKSRDVVAGQEAVHLAGTTYLPKLTGQIDDEYNAYLGRALFYNATQRTVDAMSGLLFRKDAKIEVPTGMEPWLQNIDLNGNTLKTFSEKIADDILSVGRYGILVEHPIRGEEVRSVADAERNGQRPFLTGYKAEDVINWNTTVINNTKILNLVVLREFETKTSSDEFTHECVVVYKVLDLDPETGLYRQRIFKEVDGNTSGKAFVQDGEDIFPVMNGQTMRFIPFVLISSKDCDFDVVKPPIVDLVNVNLSHYRSTADLEHGAHFTALPTAVVTGVTLEDGKKLKIGSASAWVFDSEEAKAYYLEFEGKGLDSLEKRAAVKENQMATLGARLLADEKAAAETAEAHVIKRQGENSALCQIAQSISDGIQLALRITAEWGGFARDEVVFALNKDFIPTKMDAQTLTALLQTWQSGGISFVEFIANLQRGEIVDSEKTAEDVQSEIESEGPRGLGLADEE